jgi:putative transposase
MPRTARQAAGNICYHVINRGNARATIFHKEGDYDAFIQILAESLEHVPMRILSYCLMPNHFHLVVWPREDGHLSTWMQRVTTAHVRRYHQHYHTGGTGHIWQGRFKSFPIQEDAHLLAVYRYVERNPLRASLCETAQTWRWSSLQFHKPAKNSAQKNNPLPTILDPGPIDRPKNWITRVNQAESQAELDAIRKSIARGSPYGDDSWSIKAALKLGLESTLRPRGRPKNHSS